jgi:hypothetical protein
MAKKHTEPMAPVGPGTERLDKQRLNGARTRPSRPVAEQAVSANARKRELRSGYRRRLPSRPRMPR